MKISPSLKNHQDAENESSTSRSRLRSESGPPQVRQPEEEDRRQRPPDPASLIFRPNDPFVAAGHRPGDLGAGPGLGHAAGRVVDLGEHDLAGVLAVDQTLTVQTRLSRRRRSPGRVRPSCRVAGDPVGDLRDRRERARSRVLVSCGSARRRDERRLDEATLLVVDAARSARPRRGAGGTSERARRPRTSDAPAATRPTARHACVTCRNDQSLFPRKLSGVTSTIATACAGTLGSPRATSSASTARLAPSAASETTRNFAPWRATWPRCAAERPEPVPGVVVRHGDDERADRRGEVVEPGAVDEQRVDAEVDGVAGRADDAELARAGSSSVAC